MDLAQTPTTVSQGSRHWNLATSVFYVWLLSLPFYNISVIGTLSVDNILAPLLVLLWPFSGNSRPQQSSRFRNRQLLIVTGLMGVYGVSQLLSILDAPSAFWLTAYGNARRSLYFLIPIFYINDVAMLRRVNSLAIVITLMGSASAFLVAMGILHLEATRFSPSRIGLDLIPKSTGLIGSYGDLALLSAYTALLTIALGKKIYFFGLDLPLIKTGVLAIVFLGLVGSQSRSMLITLCAAICVYMSLRFFSKRRGANRLMWIVFIISLAIPTAAGVGFFEAEITNFLSQLGGKSAEGTAQTRLIQYQFALREFAKSPLLGVPGDVYARYTEAIYGIHNMWLRTALQGGLVSMAALALLIVKALVGAMRRIDDIELNVEARVTSSLMIAFLLTTLFYPALTQLFWVVFGIATSVSCLGYPSSKSNERALDSEKPENTGISVLHRALSDRAPRQDE